MKLKFWKRSKKSKTAKASKDDKCQRKSEDCAECESLRTIVEGKFIGNIVEFTIILCGYVLTIKIFNVLYIHFRAPKPS